ncbi:MAG: hypothetical protein AB7K08_00260 [Microbacteriaceae bacterium]
MAADEHDTIDRSENPVPRPRRIPPAVPVVGILLGIVGTVVMAYAFVNGISAALDGANGNTAVFIGLFIGGGVLAFAAIVIGAVGLVRGAHRILSFFSLIIGLVPAVVIVLIRIANG